MVASTSKFKYIVCDPELCIGCQLCEYICSYTKTGEFNSYRSRIRTVRVDEVLITAESPIGFRRWMIEYGLELRPGQHELGGAAPYALTRDMYFKSKHRLVAGERPVPEEFMDVAKREIIVASEDDITEKILGAKRRKSL